MRPQSMAMQTAKGGVIIYEEGIMCVIKNENADFEQYRAFLK